MRKQNNSHNKTIIDLMYHIDNEQIILNSSDSELYKETIDLLCFKIDLIKKQIALLSTI